MNSPIELIVHAGPHWHSDTPLSVELGQAAGGQTQARLTETGSGRVIPCQMDGSALVFILPAAGPGEVRRLRVEPGVEGAKHGGVKLTDGANGLAIETGGKPLTTYRYLTSGEYPISGRPFFYPLLGPGGLGMTRNYPMRKDVHDEEHDHPHHTGLYVAFGDVNGTDNWSEEKGHGYQTHKKFSELTSGPVFGRFVEQLNWESSEHRKVCEEERRITFWNTPQECRIIDFCVTFKASDGALKFGDTKEGGIVTVRVPTSMDGNKGGRIENSAGGIGEAETWGRSAHWVDYNGTVDGKHAGIAILDHPLNLRHPAPWHVRDYGLFGANPFGQSHYKASLLQSGDYTVAAGESLVFRYRVVLHRGDARHGGVTEKWNDYAFPPRVERANPKNG